MPSVTHVAFFGATGDCAGFCLANTLQAGITCRALARTPSKLVKSLLAKGASEKVIEANLTIIHGDIRNIEACKRTLQLENGGIVDKIISSIGSLPKLQWSFIQPITLYDETICQEGAATIISAIKEIRAPRQPIMISVSTTGISRSGPSDVPVLYYGLYHWLLAVPHQDKFEMERIVREAADQDVIANFVTIKPTLLFDGEGLGTKTVRSGVDEAPAVGYTIRRKDVGDWIAENLVKAEIRPVHLGKGVTLTY